MLISIEGHSVADFDTQSAFNRWWTTTFTASWIQSTLVVIRLPLRWACYSRTKLRNWRLDTHTMMASFDTNDFMTMSKCMLICCKRFTIACIPHLIHSNKLTNWWKQINKGFLVLLKIIVQQKSSLSRICLKSAGRNYLIICF